MNGLPPLFAAPPSVYAVGGAYCVCVATTAQCTMAVECGGRSFFDHANGILRSGRTVHMATLPQSVLDRARAYTVVLREIRERKPYFTETGDVHRLEVRDFRPCRPRGSSLRVLNVADTHSLVDAPVSAAAAACAAAGGPPDLLALGGDIPEDCGSPERMAVPHVIAGRISEGRIPCVFARGNHDLRGVSAELYAELTPTDGGRSYYEFRAGPVWGLVLDGGEDKADSHAEYGHTVCCEAFREEQEQWLRSIVRRGPPPGARWRVVVCHIPLPYRLEAPFDIEGPRWKRWCGFLRKLKVQAMLTGHLHECWLEPPGGPHDSYGAPCPVVCSSRLSRERHYHVVGDVRVSTSGSVSLRCFDSLGQLVMEDSAPAGAKSAPSGSPARG